MSERLPFVAESIDEARDRFSVALERIYPANVLTDDRPGQKPENVFDFDSGLRLIVSRDRLEDGDVRIHVSASLEEGSHLAEAVRHGLTPSVFRSGHVLPTLQEIAGAFVLLSCQSISPQGVVHWFAEFTEIRGGNDADAS